MYETSDGEYVPFDLSNKNMLNYWKENIRINLRFVDI